jgi:zinc/manganese transport system permease protein
MDLDAFALLATPFVACVILVGIHAYLGIHVLARGVIFVDIALAQVAALGTTVAFLTGHSLDGPAAYAFSLGFTFVGATVFALSRRLRERVPQEAIIGITYVVAAAAAIVFVDKAPHGAEHIKYILVGNLLWVSRAHVLAIAGIYGVLGLFHYALRDRFLRLSFEHREQASGSAVFWDLLFYLSFGFVITSSVQIAGVLLVFSFLIVPAVFAALFTDRVRLRLLISWALGVAVSAARLILSYLLDLPTGAAIVATFGAALVLGLGARAFFPGLSPAGVQP